MVVGEYVADDDFVVEDKDDGAGDQSHLLIIFTDEAVSVILLFSQTVKVLSLLSLRLMEGNEITSTLTEPEFLQPLPSVTVTEYVFDDVGLTSGLESVEPLLHE